jgi:hypothetical protein
MTVQINNHSRRSIGFVTEIVAHILTEYHVFGNYSAGTIYEGDLKIEWRTEDDILIFTVTDL